MSPAPEGTAPSAAVRRWAWSLVGIGVAARLALVPRDLPYYAVDENEIVEQAAIFFAGDLCPSFYSYGPLLSYLLAGLTFLAWGVASLLADWRPADLIYRAVFEPTPFYAAARVLHVAAAVAAALLAARIASRRAGGPAGWATLVLGAAPLLSLNADFTVRNDTFQGLFALLALGFAGDVTRPRWRGTALAGVAAGLSLAVKPLQGLLVLPALAAGAALPAADEWRDRRWGAAGAATGRMTILGGALVAAHAVANPCSVREWGRFWTENTAWLGRQAPSTAAGWDLAWWVGLAGWPLAVFSGLGVAAAFGRLRDPTLRILLLYVLTVVGAYAFIGIRPYWYNAVLPAVLALTGTLVARLAGAAARRGGRSAADLAVVLATLLAAVPLADAVGEAWRAWSPVPSIERRPDRAAELWIEERIPSGSRLFVVGRYAQGTPRLAAETPKVHGRWADHFMYGRGASRVWNEVFRTAYRRHRHGGAPLYWITNVRRDYTDRYDDPVRVRRLHDDIPALARGAGARYVVTSSSSFFEGRWESRDDVRRIATFAAEPGARIQREIKVFELLPGTADEG